MFPAVLPCSISLSLSLCLSISTYSLLLNGMSQKPGLQEGDGIYFPL